MSICLYGYLSIYLSVCRSIYLFFSYRLLYVFTFSLATGLSIQFIIHRPQAATPPSPSPESPTTPFLSKLIVSTPTECWGLVHCHTTSGRGKKGRERREGRERVCSSDSSHRTGVYVLPGNSEYSSYFVGLCKRQPPRVPNMQLQAHRAS